MNTFLIIFLFLSSTPMILSHNIFDLDDHDKNYDHDHSHRCKYEEPAKWEKMAIEDDIDNYRQQIGEETLEIIRASTITINVHFHVLHKADGSGNLSNNVIAQQMDVLNEAFSGITQCRTQGCSGSTFDHGDTADTPFRFVLAEINRVEDHEGFNMDSNESRTLRKSLRKGSCADLNIFTGYSEYLGSATLASKCPPYNLDFLSPSDYDWVLINHQTVPGGGRDRYEEGKTLVHEVGHWLGLMHTFEGGCNDDEGDNVADTPREESPAFGCQVGRKTCSDKEVDSIHNFMGYSDDCCMYHFTEGQTERMILQAGYYRGLTPDAHETLAPSSLVSDLSMAPSSSEPNISLAPSPSITVNSNDNDSRSSISVREGVQKMLRTTIKHLNY